MIGSGRYTMFKNVRVILLFFAWIAASIFLMFFITQSSCNLTFSGLPAVSSIHTSHPYLFFDNINECPGYAHSSADPWLSWQKDIVGAANGSQKMDFSDPAMGDEGDSIAYRGSAARDIALAYQITKDTRYSDKAKQALFNIGVAPLDNTQTQMENNYLKSAGLLEYSMAYDWVQPTLSVGEDAIIRDKLAQLAGSVYDDLNDNGTSRGYVSFWDYHGRAYFAVAMAGLALNDYTNPNHLNLSSGPEDWIKCGTYYMWVNDPLHDFNRSLASWGMEESTGKDYSGYNDYTDEDMILFAQAYSHVYNRNYFDDYPLAQKHFLAETWSSLPNEYSATFETATNELWEYEPLVINLYDANNQSYLLNRYDRVQASQSLLQYPRVESSISESTSYLLVNDYSSIPRTFPMETSHLDSSSMFQVFRQNWNNDSEWLSLRTFDPMYITSNRVEARQDQLGLEYYGKGDLLMADGGEDRYILDTNYAMYENYHNTVAIEDPREPFSTSAWADSPARGIFKGLSYEGIVTPSSVQYIMQTPWMESLGANVTISKVAGNNWSDSQPLSSSIQYERSILFPENDYFIIVDRFEGSQPWVYRDIFRPTSLSITPTLDLNKDGTFDKNEIGHVNGKLTIGGVNYDWLSLPYNSETSTGKNTSLITWDTTNPYGRSVEMRLYSVPSSDILATKGDGCIGGHDYETEVYSPVLYYRSGPQSSLYRVTVLLSRFTSDAQMVPQAVPVSGNGNALKVSAPGYEDYAYTGKGLSSFGPYTTDADTVYVRVAGSPIEYTLINGTFIDNGNKLLISTTKSVDYLSLKKDGSKVTFDVSCNNATGIDLYGTSSGAKEVKMDGSPYSDWKNNGASMIITAEPGEHTYEVNA